MILPGIEPGISGSVDRRLIHWATGPVDLCVFGCPFGMILVFEGGLNDHLMTRRVSRKFMYRVEKCRKEWTYDSYLLL